MQGADEVLMAVKRPGYCDLCYERQSNVPSCVWARHIEILGGERLPRNLMRGLWGEAARSTRVIRIV